jgi:hypothetical protein
MELAVTAVVFLAIAERDAYRLAAAIDTLLGYPRAHPEGELTRRGRGPHAPTVRTETQCAILRLVDGRYVVTVDDVVRALDGRQVTVTDGGARLVTIDADLAVEIDTTGATPLVERGGIVVVDGR